MTKRILKSILVVSVAVLVMSTTLTMGILYRYFGKQSHSSGYALGGKGS